jgi:hypothetical protein
MRLKTLDSSEIYALCRKFFALQTVKKLNVKTTKTAGKKVTKNAKSII